MRRFFTLHSSLFTLIIVMIAAPVALAGCKTREMVVTEHHTDTLRLTQHHRDSIYLHDSTFVREYIQATQCASSPRCGTPNTVTA